MWKPADTPPGYKRKNELKKNHNTFEAIQSEFYTELKKAIFKAHSAEAYGIKPETETRLRCHDLAPTDHSLGFGGYSYELVSAKPMKALIEHQGGRAYRLRIQWPDVYVWQTSHEFTGDLNAVLADLVRYSSKRKP